MDIAARSLSVKRKVISRLMDEGLYPYTRRYLGTFKNHFSTIGMVGMNEAILNAAWLKDENMTTEKGRAFAIEVLNHMRTRLSDYQEQYGDLYNLEATPAESTSYRFAKHDTEEFPGILTAAKDGNAPYYTNSSHLPVGYTDDIFDALELEDELQTLYTSGTVFHGFLGERLPDWQSAATLVRKIAQNFKLPYYTLSPTITGYYRPVRNWNDGKVSEFQNRKTYNTEQVRIDRENKLESDAEVSAKVAYTEQAAADAAKKAAIFPKTAEIPDKQMMDAAKNLAAKIMNSSKTASGIPANGKRYLISTHTCPNCNMVKKMLQEAHVEYTPLFGRCCRKPMWNTPRSLPKKPKERKWPRSLISAPCPH